MRCSECYLQAEIANKPSDVKMLSTCKSFNIYSQYSESQKNVKFFYVKRQKVEDLIDLKEIPIKYKNL